MTKTIDARGKACPMPVLMARQAITEGSDRLIVLVDNETAVGNLQRMAASQGYEAAVTGTGDSFTLTLTKAGAAPAEEPAREAAPVAQKKDWVLFVGKDIVGDGDRMLGANLMRMLFYTLTQSEDLPGAVLFMNSGVLLAAEDEQIISHLKELRSRGVEVLVCGTCLNFYSLTDPLAVGTVSNMYDILTRMQTASKVVTL